MNCSNCFNGCVTITSDQCVKYTGIDVDELQITNGESYSSMEEKIIIKILEIMAGYGIVPTLSPTNSCDEIKNLIPDIQVATLNEYLYAIIQVVCQNVTKIEDLQDFETALNSAYTIGCITGVTGTDLSDTHKVLQAVISNFCTHITNYDAFKLDVQTNYATKTFVNDAITAAVGPIPSLNVVSNKMVPFTAIEYYGPLTNFDAAGVGLDLTGSGGLDWRKIYLCNGAHGTPDKRGRIGVGVTTVPGGGAFNPAVDPGNPDNPNYTLTNPFGANVVTLTALQVPSHTHTATSTVTDPGHTHSYNDKVFEQKADFDTNEKVWRGVTQPVNVSTSTTGITVATTISNSGGGGSHSNIPPVLPAYYIMFIP